MRGDENNGVLLLVGMVRASPVRPDMQLLLGACIGLPLPLLLLWGATACIDEPVADLRLRQ